MRRTARRLQAIASEKATGNGSKHVAGVRATAAGAPRPAFGNAVDPGPAHPGRCSQWATDFINLSIRACERR
jgi:hypothetical protein